MGVKAMTRLQSKEFTKRFTRSLAPECCPTRMWLPTSL